MSKVILGIDVGKSELVLALLINEKFIKARVSNDINGFTEIIKLFDKYKVTSVMVCLEATGRYGEQVADFLYAHDHEVAVVNPCCIKSFAKSKLIIHKTDAVDARVIAEYASKNDLTLYRPRTPAMKELRELCKALEVYKAQQTQIKCHIESSTSSQVDDSWNRLLEHIKKEMIILQEYVEKLLDTDSRLQQHCTNLQTIPGIGKTTAIALLSYIPDLAYFKTARQLAAYAGLVPRQRTSGTSVKGKSRLSKQGSSRLRKALYFPAIVALKYNPAIFDFYDKLKRRGKAKMAAIGAVMRKLVHIIFAILKNNIAFDIKYNLAN